MDEDVYRLIKESFMKPLPLIDFHGFQLPGYYGNFAEDIEKFQVYDDDVWVCSFPKSGTTWVQEMVWCIANDLNYEGANINIIERFPFLESTALFDYRTAMAGEPGLEKLSKRALNSVEYLTNLAGPRFIKTHLPFDLLPRQIRTAQRKPKIIHVARNPKDTCISYFYHCKAFESYSGDFDEFCNLFLDDRVGFGPFWKTVLSYWKQRERDNILFVKYEDMKSNLKSVIQKTADFLGKRLETQEIEILQKHLSFESMKVNPAVNYEKSIELVKTFRVNQRVEPFIRNGQVNRGKGMMSDDVIAQFDSWTDENLCNTNLSL